MEEFARKELDIIQDTYSEEMTPYRYITDPLKKIAFLESKLSHKEKTVVHCAVHVLVSDYRRSGMFEKAEMLAAKYLDEIDDKFYAGSILRDVGVIQKMKGNLRTGMNTLQRALKSLNATPTRDEDPFVRHEIGFCCFDIADIFIRRNNLQKAYEYYKKSLEMFYSQGEYFNFADCIHVQVIAVKFAEICDQLNRLNESTKTLMRHLKVFDRYRDHTTFFLDLRFKLIKRIASSYYQIGQINTSVQLYERCFSLLKKYNPTQRNTAEYIKERTGILNVLCIVYFQRGDKDKLMEYSRLMPQTTTGIPVVDKWGMEVKRYCKVSKDKKMLDLVRKTSKKEKIKKCHFCGIEDG